MMSGSSRSAARSAAVKMVVVAHAFSSRLAKTYREF